MPQELICEAFRNLEVLRLYRRSSLLESKDFRRLIYQGLSRRGATRPDHLIKNRQGLLMREGDGIGELLINIFERVNSKYLHSTYSRKLNVDNALFEEWQGIITEVPPLLFLSFSMYKRNLLPNLVSKIDLKNYVEKHMHGEIGHSILPSIRDNRLDDVINRNKLDDLHIHLNGTTEIELLWRTALERPHAFSQAIRGADDKNIVKELYGLEELDFTQNELLTRLRVAKMLRAVLLDCAINNKEVNQQTLADINSRAEFESASFSDKDKDKDNKVQFARIDSDSNIEGFTHHIDSKLVTPLVNESLLLIKLFSHLESAKNENFAHLFYYYLLIKCQLMRLVVQQTQFYGFDQFQKITVNEIRSDVESDYEARFSQVANDCAEDIDRLEGRFAPSKKLAANKARLSSILQGYSRYRTSMSDKEKDKTNSKSLVELLKTDKNYTGKLKLSLVAHFIKQPDKRANKIATMSEDEVKQHNLGWCCRHYQLRNEVEKTRRALMALQLRYSDLSEYLTGFDAAANELDAGPEVFAPVFRRLRQDGYHNFTYHAGEDYVHLLSGIRTVDEALRFLDLNHGNRIGHGTAVGIDPALWRNRLGKRVVMKQGERLDDLVFAYHILKKADCSGKVLNLLQSGIRTLTNKIYCVEPKLDNTEQPKQLFSFEYITPEDLHESWKLRYLDPILVFDLKSKCQHSIRTEIVAEIEIIKELKRSKPRAFNLLERYHGIHDVNFIRKYNKLIEVDIDTCPIEQVIDKNVLRILQKSVLRKISKKQMAIESLPTSNLRISFYENYSEHHIFNWLGVGDEEGMEVPVVLGSDDPGIFSTNLRNEYAHVLIELDKRLAPMEAIAKLEQIVKNGKIWRFDN
ncbi:hypothetical protein J8L86_09470 [Shewanella sp. MMG014]|uniref:hypothetical protein n=1 Tax=Shewanella sp. MMG014 TaxID=2822691 RepID=UPI001B379D8C|nr:hypothetical protein [Shewanella sp. MMG014]MBQ4890068.1 hypothetical protein [Shewanella sp. MMG014]